MTDPSTQYEVLLQNILSQREKAANTIIHHWRRITHSKLSLKSKILQYLLISEHIHWGTIINNHIQRYLYRKHISAYFSKKKTCYIIESSFSNKNGNPHLKVYIDNSKSLTFPFEYCSFLKKFVIYFPKNKITSKSYKVNFISNDQIIINPNYPCVVHNNMFVNVIDFEVIREQELEYAKQFRKEIVYYIAYLKRNGIELGRSGDMEEEEDKMGDSFSSEGFGSSGDLCGMEGSGRVMRSATFQRKLTAGAQRGRHVFGSGSTKDLPTIGSNGMLTRPKSILKAMRRQSTNVLSKKVSFGNVQFSY